MRVVVAVISFLLGAGVGWQIGLLASLGALRIPGTGPVVGVGTTFLYAGLGALFGGLVSMVVCLLILSLVFRMVRLR